MKLDVLDKPASALTIVVALLTAAYVDTHGGDSGPYISVATAALGYGIGSTVQKVRGRK